MAYVDESGDDGTGGSRTYALGCTMVDASAWPDTFDGLLKFRRWVRATCGVNLRDEIKANYLLRNGGAFRKLALSPRARREIYRGHMNIQRQLDMKAFAVVIDKAQAQAKFGSTRVASDIAWEYLLQRLERRAHYEKTECLLIHDEGDALAVRGRVRRARRAGTAGSAFGTGMLNVPFDRLVDDPVSRDSRQSFFLQIADLNAYAAFRRLNPVTQRPGMTPVVPQQMWDQIGSALSPRGADLATSQRSFRDPKTEAAGP
jgi:hypothetical protein